MGSFRDPLLDELIFIGDAFVMDDFMHNCVVSFTFSLSHFLHATIDLFYFYLERIYYLSAFE